MLRKRAFTAVVLLVALLFSQDFFPLARAQDSPPPTPEELDQLLAPVALYPDSLLAQITTASTNPQEILDVDNWLQQNSNLSGAALTDAAQAAGFDPAFIALVNFPQVVTMMAENIDDYAAIGDAFSADQASVTASIQRLRAQAYASGALRGNSQYQVDVQQPAGQPIYVIQPANPQVVYVPVYDPTVVYVAPRPGIVASSLITFGGGISIGVLVGTSQPWGWGGWGWNWGSNRAYYNHTDWVRWGNPYRPPRPWYRPPPVYYNNRPGQIRARIRIRNPIQIPSQTRGRIQVQSLIPIQSQIHRHGPTRGQGRSRIRIRSQIRARIRSRARTPNKIHPQGRADSQARSRALIQTLRPSRRRRPSPRRRRNHNQDPRHSLGQARSQSRKRSLRRKSLTRPSKRHNHSE